MTTLIQVSIPKGSSPTDHPDTIPIVGPGSTIEDGPKADTKPCHVEGRISASQWKTLTTPLCEGFRGSGPSNSSSRGPHFGIRIGPGHCPHPDVR